METQVPVKSNTENKCETNSRAALHSGLCGPPLPVKQHVVTFEILSED